MPDELVCQVCGVPSQEIIDLTKYDAGLWLFCCLHAEEFRQYIEEHKDSKIIVEEFINKIKEKERNNITNGEKQKVEGVYLLAFTCSGCGNESLVNCRPDKIHEPELEGTCLYCGKQVTVVQMDVIVNSPKKTVDACDSFDKLVEDFKMGDVLVDFCAYILTCKKVNDDEWMTELAKKINAVCIAINDEMKFVYDSFTGLILGDELKTNEKN